MQSTPLRKSMDDQSASILLELKNSGEEALPCEQPLEDGQCQLVTCLLCTRGVPALLVRSPTWASIMRVVFFCLQHDNSSKCFFNLKTDVYGFMTTHWKKLCLDKKRSDNWHKQIQDMLSHSKNLFESGMERYKQNGFWRMKQLQDPWTIRKDRRTKLKRTANENHPPNEPDSPERKRLRREESSDSDVELQIDNADECRGTLEEEVKALKETVSALSKESALVKEELHKRDVEIVEKTVLFSQLLDQYKLLHQVHSSCSQNINKQWDAVRPDFGNQCNVSNQMRFFPFPHNILSPTSPNKYITDDDEEFFSNHGELQVPQLVRLNPFSMQPHI